MNYRLLIRTSLQSCGLVALLFAMVQPTALGAEPRTTPSQAVAAADDPDALYHHRDDLPSARRAADIWQAHATTEFDSAWKLSRVCYWMGTHAPDAERTGWLERGVAAGKSAIMMQPNQPEGHFWMAANMGEKAQRSTLYAAGNKNTIRDELLKVVAMQPGWQGGSAEAALGQWYFKAPNVFGIGGGDPKKSEQFFKSALGYDPHNKSALLFYADFLLDHKRTSEAKVLLQQIVDEPVEPEWAPEESGFKQQALDRLSKIKGT